jgi:hypothetical protein
MKKRAIEPFDMVDFLKVISKTKKKAPGKDGLFINQIKDLNISVLGIILDVYNEIWISGSFPEIWKQAVVIPLLKKGKVAGDPTSYRPISLLPIMGKLLESLVHPRMNDYFTDRKLIPDFQTGFRKGKSTSVNLRRLYNNTYFQSTIGMNKRPTASVFFDAKKAFDTVWYNGLIVKLARDGVPAQIIRFLGNWITDRSLVVRIGRELSKSVNLRSGVPQGSVISPLIWNYWLGDCPTTASPHAYTALYADDIALWVSHPQISHLIRILNSEIGRLVAWTRRKRLVLTPEKTYAIATHTLKGKRDKIKKQHIYMDEERGVKIEWQTQAVLLGILFHETGSFAPHIMNKVRLANARVRALWRFNQVIPGKTLYNVYKAAIEPILTYGTEVIYESINDNLAKKLLSVEFNALRCCYRLRKETSKAEMFDLFEGSSIMERINKRRENFLLKNMNEHLIMYNETLPYSQGRRHQTRKMYIPPRSPRNWKRMLYVHKPRVFLSDVGSDNIGNWITHHEFSMDKTRELIGEHINPIRQRLWEKHREQDVQSAYNRGIPSYNVLDAMLEPDSDPQNLTRDELARDIVIPRFNISISTQWESFQEVRIRHPDNPDSPGEQGSGGEESDPDNPNMSTSSLEQMLETSYYRENEGDITEKSEGMQMGNANILDGINDILLGFYEGRRNQSEDAGADSVTSRDYNEEGCNVLQLSVGGANSGSSHRKDDSDRVPEEREAAQISQELTEAGHLSDNQIEEYYGNIFPEEISQNGSILNNIDDILLRFYSKDTSQTTLVNLSRDTEYVQNMADNARQVAINKQSETDYNYPAETRRLPAMPKLREAGSSGQRTEVDIGLISHLEDTGGKATPEVNNGGEDRNEPSGWVVNNSIDVEALVKKTLAAHRIFNKEVDMNSTSLQEIINVTNPDGMDSAKPWGTGDIEHIMNEYREGFGISSPEKEDCSQDNTDFRCSTQKYTSHKMEDFQNISISPIKKRSKVEVQQKEVRADLSPNNQVKNNEVLTSTQSSATKAPRCEISPIKKKDGYRRPEGVLLSTSVEAEQVINPHYSLGKVNNHTELSMLKDKNICQEKLGRTFIHLENGHIAEDISERESTIPERYPAMNPATQDWSNIRCNHTEELILHKGRYNKKPSKRRNTTRKGNRGSSPQERLNISIDTNIIPHKLVVEAVSSSISDEVEREGDKDEPAGDETRKKKKPRSKKTGSRRRTLTTIVDGKITQTAAGPNENGRAPESSALATFKASSREITFASDLKHTLDPSKVMTSQDIIFVNARTSGLVWRSSITRENRKPPQSEEKTRTEPSLEFVFSDSDPLEERHSAGNKSRDDLEWPPTRPPDLP